jgi:hypothetical protein
MFGSLPFPTIEVALGIIFAAAGVEMGPGKIQEYLEIIGIVFGALALITSIFTRSGTGQR